MPEAYVAYGLRIHSALSLPELVPAPGPSSEPADIEIRIVTPNHATAATDSAWDIPALDPAAAFASTPGALPVHIGRDAEGHYGDIRWPDVGRFVVRIAERDGVTRVSAVPHAGTADAVLRLILLGPVLALTLHLRGWLVLHGSAVEIGGGAVAMLGTSGRGKSTTAGALTARGHPLVADDVVAILPAGGPITTVPAYPQLKLQPDAATAITGSAETLPRLTAVDEKRSYHPIERFAAAAMPVRTILILDDAPAESGHDAPPLARRDALLAIVQHAYGAPMLEEGDATRRFTQLGRVAATVPVRRLRIRRGLEHLPTLVALIESLP